MEPNKKFIIETDSEKGDCVIIAKCNYHKQLAYLEENVKGGGWWDYSEDGKTWILKGSSEQFGKASLEDLLNCFKNKNVYSNKTLSYPIYDMYEFRYDDYTYWIDLKTGERIEKP